MVILYNELQEPVPSHSDMEKRYGCSLTFPSLHLPKLMEVKPFRPPNLSGERVRTILRTLEEMGYKTRLNHLQDPQYRFVDDPEEKQDFFKRISVAVIDLRRGTFRFYTNASHPSFLDPIADLYGLAAGKNLYADQTDEQLLELIVKRYPNGIGAKRLFSEDPSMHRILSDRDLLTTMTR